MIQLSGSFIVGLLLQQHTHQAQTCRVSQRIGGAVVSHILQQGSGFIVLPRLHRQACLGQAGIVRIGAAGEILFQGFRLFVDGGFIHLLCGQRFHHHLILLGGLRGLLPLMALPLTPADQGCHGQHHGNNCGSAVLLPPLFKQLRLFVFIAHVICHPALLSY